MADSPTSVLGYLFGLLAPHLLPVAVLVGGGIVAFVLTMRYIMNYEGRPEFGEYLAKVASYAVGPALVFGAVTYFMYSAFLKPAGIVFAVYVIGLLLFAA